MKLLGLNGSNILGSYKTQIYRNTNSINTVGPMEYSPEELNVV